MLIHLDPQSITGLEVELAGVGTSNSDCATALHLDGVGQLTAAVVFPIIQLDPFGRQQRQVEVGVLQPLTARLAGAHVPARTFRHQKISMYHAAMVDTRTMTSKPYQLFRNSSGDLTLRYSRKHALLQAFPGLFFLCPLFGFFLYGFTLGECPSPGSGDIATIGCLYSKLLSQAHQREQPVLLVAPKFWLLNLFNIQVALAFFMFLVLMFYGFAYSVLQDLRLAFLGRTYSFNAMSRCISLNGRQLFRFSDVVNVCTVTRVRHDSEDDVVAYSYEVGLTLGDGRRHSLIPFSCAPKAAHEAESIASEIADFIGVAVKKIGRG